MKTKARNIGIKVKTPEKAEPEKNDPFYGSLGVRGKLLVGTIIKAKAPKTAVFESQRIRKVPKFERYEKRRTRITVHNPPSINAKAGDVVTIAECRPISKSKRFVIIEKTGSSKLFQQEQEAKEEGKFKKTAKEIKNIEKEETTESKGE